MNRFNSAFDSFEIVIVPLKFIGLDENFRKKGQGYNLTKMPDFYQNIFHQNSISMYPGISMNAFNSAFDSIEIVIVP